MTGRRTHQQASDQYSSIPNGVHLIFTFRKDQRI